MTDSERSADAQTLRVGVLTVDDDIYWGYKENTCLPLVSDWLVDNLPNTNVELVALVQKRESIVAGTLIVWADEVALDLIFTIGGEEVAEANEEDVALEATRIVVEALGGAQPPVTGSRGGTVIINLPAGLTEMAGALTAARPFLHERW